MQHDSVCFCSALNSTSVEIFSILTPTNAKPFCVVLSLLLQNVFFGSQNLGSVDLRIRILGTRGFKVLIFYKHNQFLGMCFCVFHASQIFLCNKMP
jgi:hypothetical protein